MSEAIYNVISIDKDSNIYWNSEKVSANELAQLLKSVQQLDPETDLVLRSEMGVSCVELERVRGQMDAALQCDAGTSRCVEGIPYATPEPRKNPK